MSEGFNAMGEPVPYHRRENAYAAMKDMGITDAEQAMGLIDVVANHLARDNPYAAMTAAMDRGLDLTGTYRLLATLLTDGDSR